MHFAVGPRGGNYKKHEALDFCFTVANLAKIPMSNRWIVETPMDLSKSLPAKNIELRQRDFIEVVRKREIKLFGPQFSDAVQLTYRLMDTGA
jgi:hypothetical protein